MKKRTSTELLVECREYKVITDFDTLIQGIKEELLSKGIEVGRIALEATTFGVGVRIGFYKALSSEELKELKEEDERKKLKALAELEKKQEQEKLRLQKASELSKKLSDAAKKGWIRRKIELEERKEKERIAKEAHNARVAEKRAERAAKLEEEKRAKDFLKRILEEED